MEDQEPLRTARAGERRLGLDCLRCGTVVHSEGTWQLRTGGSSGGMTALFGACAEIGERIIDVDVTRCLACGHLESSSPSTDR